MQIRSHDFVTSTQLIREFREKNKNTFVFVIFSVDAQETLRFKFKNKPSWALTIQKYFLSSQIDAKFVLGS